MIFEYPGEYTIITFKFGAEDLFQLFPMLLTSVRAWLTTLERQGLISRVGWVTGSHGVKIGSYQAVLEVVA